jgi:NADPH:quinone reductase-like Zn-dependent oxidoreductase
MLERGTVQHNIGCRLPLAQTAKAHEMVERGEVTGNLVLQV